MKRNQICQVAFVLPSFPNLTGTFYVNEIVEVGKQVGTMVFALERGTESQAGMALLAGRPYLSGARGMER